MKKQVSPAPADRILSAILIIFFTLTSVGWASPEFDKSSEKISQKSFSDQVSSFLTPETAKVQKTFIPDRCLSSDADCPLVLHIQDAHANPEAQRQIQKIIERIYQQSNHTQVAVESAEGPLDPEVFNLFPEYPNLREKAIDDLAEHGELTGAELFLLDLYRDPKTKPSQVPVVGVENKKLFVENLADFKMLLQKRLAIQMAYSRLTVL